MRKERARIDPDLVDSTLFKKIENMLFKRNFH
jgi:hypothetical protein